MAGRHAAHDDEATGIPNRTGKGTDPDPTPPRGEGKKETQKPQAPEAGRGARANARRLPR
jgi:hypothetical protein